MSRKREPKPWWREELAREWTDRGRPVLREGVVEIVLEAQGRQIEIAYVVGPVERAVNWAVWRDRQAPYGITIPPDADPLAAVEAVLEPEPVWSLDVPRRGWPWWARQLGDPARIDKYQRIDTRFQGRKAVIIVGKARRLLDWAARGGAVGEDGVWFSGLSTSIGPRVEPRRAIQRVLDRVKSEDGRPVQPWESDVDGFAPGKIRRINRIARHLDPR